MTRPPEEDAPRWLLLAYRVPTEPSSNRVAIWRDLKRLGAYYPQQAVCILPGRPELRDRLAEIRGRVAAMGGTSTYLEIPWLPDEQDEELRQRFRAMAGREYEEIIEECETRFEKEIEFEISRRNFTFEEVEEIRQDLDKIRRWFSEARERDWFGSPLESEAAVRLKRCAELLADFEARVFEWTLGTDDHTGRRRFPPE